VRRQAVLAFGQIGSSRDAEEIIIHLKDEFWPARIAAAETLGKLGNPEAVEHLLGAIEDDDEDLALAAANALGEIGDERAVHGLTSLLHRESWTLQHTAISILGEMRIRKAVPELLRMLNEETLDLAIPIIQALGKIGHPDSFKPLQEMFTDGTKPEVRAAIIDAFASLGNPEIIPILVGLTNAKVARQERQAAIRALGRMKASEARKPLMEALKSSDPLISREALSSLKEILTLPEFRKMEDALAKARKHQEAFRRHFQEGMRHMRIGAMKDAENELKAAVQLNPKAAYVYSALGNLYYKTGKLIDATKAYVMATSVEPRDVTLKLNLGMVYYRRRAFKEAMAVFVAIFKAVPQKSQQGLYAARMIEKIKIESRLTP